MQRAWWQRSLFQMLNVKSDGKSGVGWSRGHWGQLMESCVHPKAFVLRPKNNGNHERLFSAARVCVVCVCDMSRFLLWEGVCCGLYK